MTLKSLRKKVTRAALRDDSETKALAGFVRKCRLGPGQKALDVGCGYGRNLVLMRDLGIDVQGVDANPEIVKVNRDAGLPCLTVQELEKSTERYDLILMSHVVEHFQPADLLKFIDSYLDRLESGGYIIVLTPLYSKYFYEDFDHIKPYHPSGLSMVFGSENAQVQYYSRNKLKLVDIWFRKGPFKRIFSRDLFLGESSAASTAINVMLTLLFKATLGLAGRVDGWMGLYKKI